jgi:hypothetical protein
LTYPGLQADYQIVPKGKLAERRGRKASGLTDSFPKTAGLPRSRDSIAAADSPERKSRNRP